MSRRALAGMLLFLLVLVLWFVFGGHDLGLDGLQDDATRTPENLGELIDVDPRTSDGAAPTLAGSTSNAPVARGPVEVEVISPLGLPLVGVVVRLERDSWNATGELEYATTDASGRVVFARVDHDGRAIVDVGTARVGSIDVVRRALATRGDVGWPALEEHVSLWPAFSNGVPIHGPSLTYRLREGVPLSVDVVKTDDGRRADVQVLTFPCFIDAGSEPVAMGRLLAIGVGPEVALQLAVPAPEGYVAFDHPPYQLAVPSGTRRIELKLPVRPEARVRVEFSDDTPTGWHETFRPQLRVAGMGVGRTRVEFDAFGNARLRGVPFVAGAKVQVEGEFGASGDDEETVRGADGSVRLSADPRAEHVLRLGTPEDWILDHVETDNDLPYEESFGHAEGGGADADLVVRVTDPSGRPAPLARVWFCPEHGESDEIADVDGVARFEGYYPGRGTVSVWGAGAPTHVDDVVLRSGEVTEVDVRAVRGAYVALRVTDDEGRQVSFARFVVVQSSGLPWFDLDSDGVLRGDRFVDADGTRLLHGLEPGVVKLRAWYGNRSAEVAVEVQNDCFYDVTLRIR